MRSECILKDFVRFLIEPTPFLFSFDFRNLLHRGVGFRSPNILELTPVGADAVIVCTFFQLLTVSQAFFLKADSFSVIVVLICSDSLSYITFLLRIEQFNDIHLHQGHTRHIWINSSGCLRTKLFLILSNISTTIFLLSNELRLCIILLQGQNL